jgi:probable rRNA maturation factor
MLSKEILSAVQFHYLNGSPGLRSRRQLKAFLLSIFRREKKQVSCLSYIFCSDKYLLGINQQFLQHNDYTDIITFNLAPEKAPVEGEIYISLERVRENADNLDQFFYMELHRVIFHGALHLCGYKDKTSKDISIMREKEDFYLEKYFK